MRRRFTLRYRPPYDFRALLEFFARRAIPGIEDVDEGCYRRHFIWQDVAGTVRVTRQATGQRLTVSVDHPDPSCVADVRCRIRRMFDVDVDIDAVQARLRRDPRLRILLRRQPGLRRPGGWDGFEVAVRAVLGQQISVAAARTIAARLVQRCGAVAGLPHGEYVRAFPDVRTLACADLDSVGLTGARINTLRAVARAVSDGSVGFHGDQPLSDFVQRWTGLPGIGAWTAHYIAMRTLDHADAFPAADLVLRKALSDGGVLIPVGQLEAMAEAWRPWRTYAVLHLWRSQG